MNHYSDSNLLDGTLRLLAGKEENDRIRYDANICQLIAIQTKHSGCEYISNSWTHCLV